MPTPECTRILVGWDGSAGAAAGLRLAVKLTAAEGGELTALAVVPGFTHVEDAEDRARAINDVRVPLREAYESTVEAIGLLPGQSVSLEFVESSDVARALDRYAAIHPIGMVVVGLHGREGLLHPKMGHIANQAVRTGRCPVLVVPEPGGAAAYLSDDASPGVTLSGFFHPFRHHHAAV